MRTTPTGRPGRLASGELEPKISWSGSWSRIAEASGVVTEGGRCGKAVLDIDRGS